MIKKLPYILICIFVVLLILIPLFIKVKIECRSQYGDCPAEIISGLNMFGGKNLFVAKQKASTYLKKNFLVSAFSVQFKLPDTMLINIIVKKPNFAIKDSNSGKFELVDRKGTIIALADNSNLPTLAVTKPLGKIGTNIDSSDLFALNLISGIDEMYQVGYGMITNDALVVDMPTGVRVIFPLEGEPEVLLGALRLIYSKVTTSYLGTYSQIDMRYKNPVLR